MGASLLRRLTLCRFGMCTFRSRESDTHLWGECYICGKQSGVVSRESVRRYMQAQESDEAFMARMHAEDCARREKRAAR